MKKKITGCVWHGSTVKRERGRERERQKEKVRNKDKQRERGSSVYQA